MRRTQSTFSPKSENDEILISYLQKIRPQNTIWACSKGSPQASTLRLCQLPSHTYSKLARLRAQLLEPGPGASGGGGSGFDVSKSGDARIALVGFPSVGKSTFLSKITKTKSEVASYAFTTLTAIPGVLEYGGAEIQVLDLPGIIEGAAEGKGRGRQVISAAKVCFLNWSKLRSVADDDVGRLVT